MFMLICIKKYSFSVSNWAAPCENANVDSEVPDQPAHPHSLDQGLHSQLIESLNTIECKTRKILSACAG